MAHGLDDGPGRVALGEVGGMDFDRNVVPRPNLVARRLQRLLRARGDVHRAAFSREPQGAGEADAAAAPGDQDCLAGKFEIHGQSL